MTETREELIARWEAQGRLVRDCPACQVFYQAVRPTLVLAPRHPASPRCESGGDPHCTCDICF